MSCFASIDIGGTETVSEGIFAAIFAGQFNDTFGFQFFSGQSDRADDLQGLFVRQQDSNYTGLGLDED